MTSLHFIAWGELLDEILKFPLCMYVTNPAFSLPISQASIPAICFFSLSAPCAIFFASPGHWYLRTQIKKHLKSDVLQPSFCKPMGWMGFVHFFLHALEGFQRTMKTRRLSRLIFEYTLQAAAWSVHYRWRKDMTTCSKYLEGGVT